LVLQYLAKFLCDDKVYDVLYVMTFILFALFFGSVVFSMIRVNLLLIPLAIFTDYSKDENESSLFRIPASPLTLVTVAIAETMANLAQ
jgi:hypothetical protein